MIGHNSYELLMNFTSKLRSRLSHSSLTIYFITVDDGSGTIPCCRWRQSEESVDNGQEQLNLGQLVTVQGKISVFREQRQLTVDLICIHFYGCHSTQVIHQLECRDLSRIALLKLGAHEHA